MANRNAFIDGIVGLSPSQKILAARPLHELPKTVTVSFQGGRTALLDMTKPLSTVWAEMFDFLQRYNRPAYVEIDPSANLITQVLIPRTAQVRSLTALSNGDFKVHLLPMQAVHYVRRANPDFDLIVSALQSAKDQQATVLVTATRDEHEIIDVRTPPGSPSPPPPTPTEPVDDPPVTEQRAQELFDLMNAKSCDPCAGSEPCIPFKYPDNGCWARAHEMCRLMIGEGATPKKVWIDGNLVVDTATHPYCQVEWGWHVAPTLSVTTASGAEEMRVIDPSLCSGPVSVDEWKRIQGYPAAVLEYTDETPFQPLWGPEALVWDNGFTYDSDYSQTDEVLEQYRLELNARCEELGPPPYSCPIDKRCTFITDRSTFSDDEVGASAVFDAAFYVVVDGFNPKTELGITDFNSFAHAPAITPAVPGMSFTATALTPEEGLHPKRRQRLTWTYRVAFANTSAFTEEVREVTLTASIGGVSASAVITLIKKPNPYEIDGPTSWLSTDLRVFQIRAGETRFAATMGGTPADASTFIEQVIANLNNGNAGGQTFENDISTDQTASRLELAQTVGGTPVFNFAVARVRYRGKTLDAQSVRVFFRLFPVSTASVNYSASTTYRRGGQADVPIPLLGIQGGELATIPCFAEPRIDTATMNLNTQPDPRNVSDMPRDGIGAERQFYYGCWLDINQQQPLFPLYPFPEDGPFPNDRVTIQQLIRGAHQCLIAEVVFDSVAIPDGASPGQSDKLAQRNLAIVESANPGDIASHRIPLTFDIRPTLPVLDEGGTPDELMIHWNNTPDGCLATIYAPGIDAAQVIDMADEMYGSHSLNRVDEHTLQCDTGGITYIPVPPGVGANFAALLTLDLPETVKRGQSFAVVVRQITDAKRHGVEVEAFSAPSAHVPSIPVRWRRIVGSFQLSVPVRTKEVMLEPERRLLSVLRWIQQAIPDDNRWFPVFRRYVEQIADRVDALGGDSCEVVPSPKGEWRDAKAAVCKVLAFATAGLLGLLVLALGAPSAGWPIVLGIPLLALLIAIGLPWMVKCHPSSCRILWTVVAGVGFGATALALLFLLGLSAPQLTVALAICVLAAAIAALVGWVKCCK